MFEYSACGRSVSHQQPGLPSNPQIMTATSAPLRPTLVPYRERWMGLVDFGKMWATDKELPYLDRDEEPLGTWVAVGGFTGDVRPRKANCDPLPGLVTGTWEGATALTIVGN